MGFIKLTSIQQKVIPIAISGEDVVAIAQTGSGKTLAFAIQMLQQIVATKKIGLILVPTRELAVQINEAFTKVAGSAGLRTTLIMGGTNINSQLRQLRAKPHVVVSTPGRLIDIIDKKLFSLQNVGCLVLDEADRMLDMGFAPQLKRLMIYIPEQRQTMLFSATMSDEITKMLRNYLKNPLRIEVARLGTTAEKIDQEVIMVSRDKKNDVQKKLLVQYKGMILVFSRTKYGAKKIARQIRQMGHSADELHSNRSQNQRQKALKNFSSGLCRVLVATDIAARGIDVSDIELVLNFDLPEQVEDYVHRIGRTGRAGKSGKVISLACPEQKYDIVQIQKVINTILPIKCAEGNDLAPITQAQKPPKKNVGLSRSRLARKRFLRGRRP